MRYTKPLLTVGLESQNSNGRTKNDLVAEKKEIMMSVLDGVIQGFNENAEPNLYIVSREISPSIMFGRIRHKPVRSSISIL